MMSIPHTANGKGEVRLKASKGHRYIMVAIDYFSKWVETESYAIVGSK